ncbi:unnamed protein product [Bathycoccus prasinos]
MTVPPLLSYGDHVACCFRVVPAITVRVEIILADRVNALFHKSYQSQYKKNNDEKNKSAKFVASIKKNIEWILCVIRPNCAWVAGAQTIYITRSVLLRNARNERTQIMMKLLKPSLLIGFKHYFDRVYTILIGFKHYVSADLSAYFS